MDVAHLVKTSPWGFVIAFGGGMLSFLSPCVLPLVPGYVSLMSGLSSAQVTEQDGGVAVKVHVLKSTLLFVAGFTLVFTAFFAGAFGVVNTFFLGHQEVLNRVAAIVVIVMGLLLAGLVSPQFLMQERRLHVSPSRLGVWAAPVMGMAFAFGWTPCIGAVLAPVLAVSAEQTVGRGLFLVIAYALGLGVPFIAAGLALGRLAGVFGWVKRHFRVINLVSGLFLVLFGVLLLTHRITNWSADLIHFMDKIPLLRRLSTS
ncbi:MAG TPA: cytochrome c biogenesis protein CcdA [Acidimicrobiales bacterium]|nr:cytochrome c biogenesis protein CcdA [Acidimicrobiales bacterium]